MAEKPSTFGQALRVIAIVLFGLCSAVMLLGGIGTSCVAWAPLNFGERMAALASMQWLYILASITTTGLGVFGIWVTVALARGRRWSYRGALGMLIAGLALAGSQMIASEMLRGSSAPNNMRVYITIFTLAVFLLLRLPGLWNTLGGFTQPGGTDTPGAAAGAAIAVIGLAMLTVHLWAASTHTLGGVNYADVWHLPLTIGGSAITLIGLVVIGISALDVPAVRRLAPAAEPEM